MKPVSVADYRELARRRLPRFLFDYIDGGSFAESTLARNVSDLAAVTLRQRVLHDVSNIDLSTTLLGERIAMPVLLGPVGLAGMTARRGEVQAACAAEAAGVPFCLSMVSLCSLEEVARSATRPFCFQLYMLRDRGFIADVLARAKAARCSTLILTVDLPVPAVRYRDYRSGLAGSPGFARTARRLTQIVSRPRWAWRVGLHGRPHVLGNLAPILRDASGLEDFVGWISSNYDPSSTWRDVEWLRSRWQGSLIIKGILEVDDALQAMRSGADAILVSNHGGRQLDGVVSTARALAPIAAAVGKRIPVLVDGGVRSGLDVMRMLLLGANAVVLGRAWAWGLAADGGGGVRAVLRLIADELRAAMALSGCTTIESIGPHALGDPNACRSELDR